MKNHTKINLIQKMVISLLIVVILFTCIIPKNSYAAVEDIAGGLLKEVVQLFASLGDVVMGTLNKLMLGSDRFLSAMLPQEDVNLEEDSGSWLVEGVDNEEADVIIPDDYMDEKTFLLDASTYQIPNMLYSPENIFADNIAMLDINFLSPNTYTSIIRSGDSSDVQNADEAAESAASRSSNDGVSLRETISSWYKSFRNIAVVGLLSVLVYLAIRILISSTATDKAKYKESLRDWFVALCLVFVIHLIMSGILLLTNSINSLFSDSIDNGIIVQAKHSNEGENAGEPFKFRTNLIGLARFMAQADQWQDATAYTIIYLALVIYTCMFTFMYFKRFLWMAFFTMIAPLVALTYPLDKAGDGHAQAFNLWFKEYTMNAIIQPVHLILYTVFVSSAIDLAIDNPIYAIVAIAFLVPAEKFIKKMFRLDQSDTEGDFGSFAGGAMTMQAINSLTSIGTGNGKGGKQKNSANKEDNANENKINFAKSDNAGKLDAFNDGSADRAALLGRNNNGQDNDSQDNYAGYDNGQDDDNDEADERQRMLDDRDAWQQMVDDPNASDMDREEAQQQVDFINDDMRARGYLVQDQDGEGEPEDYDDEEYGSAYFSNTNGNEYGAGQGDSGENGEDTPEEQPDAMPVRTGKQKALGVAKFALRGAKTLGKGALFAGRGLVRATGMIGGATVGLAAGLTTGDMSKAMSYAAAGAVAGNVIGKNVNNMASRAGRGIINAPRNFEEKANNTLNKVVDTWNQDVYGTPYPREQRMQEQNDRARARLLKDEDQKAKAEEWMSKNKYTGDIKDVLNARADLYEAGVREDLMDDAMKTELKNTGSLSSDSHSQYVDAAGFISKYNYSRDNIDDEEKMARMEERVQSMVSDPNDQLRVMQMTSQMLGADSVYERRRREGRTLIGNETQQGGNGPRNNGPRNNGPTNNGQTNNGPRNNGPTNNEPTGSGPRNNGPRNNTPTNNTPTNSEGTPQEAPRRGRGRPRNNESRNNTPRNNTPRNNTPRNNTPRNNTPRNNTPRNNTPTDTE